MADKKDKKDKKGKKGRRKLDPPYPHGDFERLLPAFSGIRDITAAQMKKYGLRGLPIPYIQSDEMKAESREDRLDRVYKARNKRIEDEKKADSSRKRRDKFLEENPSAVKDARGVRFKEGGVKGKSKSKKPKVRGAGIAQRGVRPAKMF
jgi:hypothetical protein